MVIVNKSFDFISKSKSSHESFISKASQVTSKIYDSSLIPVPIFDLSHQYSYLLTFILSCTSLGFVDIDELMTLDLMKDYSADEIKREISISISASGKKRFQMKTDGKDVSVRASYRRRFEPVSITSCLLIGFHNSCPGLLNFSYVLSPTNF